MGSWQLGYSNTGKMAQIDSSSLFFLSLVELGYNNNILKMLTKPICCHGLPVNESHLHWWDFTQTLRLHMETVSNFAVCLLCIRMVKHRTARQLSACLENFWNRWRWRQYSNIKSPTRKSSYCLFKQSFSLTICTFTKFPVPCFKRQGHQNCCMSACWVQTEAGCRQKLFLVIMFQYIPRPFHAGLIL